MRGSVPGEKKAQQVWTETGTLISTGLGQFVPADQLSHCLIQFSLAGLILLTVLLKCLIPDRKNVCSFKYVYICLESDGGRNKQT